MFFIHTATFRIITLGKATGNAGAIKTGHNNGQMLKATVVLLADQPFFNIGKNRKVFVISAETRENITPDKG